MSELLSNAFKYAYPDGEGEIRVKMNADGNRYRLSVTDYGVGLSKPINESNSLGVRLVEALVSQLEGTVEFRDTGNGLHVEVSIAA